MFELCVQQRLLSLPQMHLRNSKILWEYYVTKLHEICFRLQFCLLSINWQVCSYSCLTAGKFCVCSCVPNLGPPVLWACWAACCLSQALRLQKQCLLVALYGLSELHGLGLSVTLSLRKSFGRTLIMMLNSFCRNCIDVKHTVLHLLKKTAEVHFVKWLL